MSVKAITYCALIMLMGCPNAHYVEPEGCVQLDLSVPISPDLKTPEAKCKAAQGLAGDNLICVDFDKVTGLSDPALGGWNFNANTAGCWEVRQGALQVTNFGTFTMSCGLTLPPLDFKQADKMNYQRATLALVHRVDMSEFDRQKAQVFIELDNESSHLIHQSTGRPAIAALTTTTLIVNKSDLPSALMKVYKFFLKANAAGATSGASGWQIQSIAVNATQ